MIISSPCFRRVAIGIAFGVGIFQTGWSDVGPDILAPLTNGNMAAIRRIEDRVSLASAEGNRIAEAIVCQAKIARGQDSDAYYQGRDHFSISSTPPGALCEDTEKDWLAALGKKVAGGDPFFMDVLAILCFEGLAGVPEDKQKAVALLKKAAELNCGIAKHHYGNCLARGDGVPRDLKKAAMYYRAAGELGVPWGWYNMGCLYNGWQGWSPRDLKKAMECWAKSAPLGHVRSQFNLGFYYCNGDEGFPVNKELGRQWMRSAASNGHTRAILYLADLEKKPVPRTLPAVIEDKNTGVVSTFIAFDKIKESITGSKVAVVCFVDSYDPSKLGGNKTPSQMLDIYLGGLRTLKKQQKESSDAGTANPEDVKIFIVECREDTRAKVREFDKQCALKAADGSIPVLYVFHLKKPVKTYTYCQDPGPNGIELKSLVENLLAKDPEMDGRKMKSLLDSLIKPVP